MSAALRGASGTQSAREGPLYWWTVLKTPRARPRAGATLPIDATLLIAPPRVNPRRARRSLVMTREMQEAMPTGRGQWSYAQLITGVKVGNVFIGGAPPFIGRRRRPTT